MRIINEIKEVCSKSINFFLQVYERSRVGQYNFIIFFSFEVEGATHSSLADLTISFLLGFYLLNALFSLSSPRL